MQKVLTAAQMREVDRLTTERYGIPSILLMENAAHAVARVITDRMGGSVKGKSILILCGPGNNGGDGAALARILWQAGAKIIVLSWGKLKGSSDDSIRNFQILERLQGHLSQQCIDDRGQLIAVWDRIRSGPSVDVIVDAVFGTGLNRPLDRNYVDFLDIARDYTLDRHRSLKVAVDVPSGLTTEIEESLECPLEADVTVTFTSPKPETVLVPSYRECGELVVADIGSPRELILEAESQLFVADQSDAQKWFGDSRFFDDSYKNKRGHTVILAGSEDYSGAAVLAGNAAMRSGVGLVTLACPANAKTEIASRLLPEVILSTLESDEFGGHLEKADVIAVGCGLDAEDPEIGGLVREMVLGREVPRIVDAGALSVLSPFDIEANWPPAHAGGSDRSHTPLILTPHEGEFLRLLGTDDKDAIKDRVAAVREFATTNNVILVLKGERVLIGHPDGRVVVNPTGNSGLGKAGNGDTLTGILAGFVAQAVKMDIDIFETVVAAVYIAGMAGDVADKKYGKRVMTASDVRECLVEVFADLGVV